VAIEHIILIFLYFLFEEHGSAQFQRYPNRITEVSSVGVLRLMIIVRILVYFFKSQFEIKYSREYLRSRLRRRLTRLISRQLANNSAIICQWS
jgi:hypothetical protein